MLCRSRDFFSCFARRFYRSRSAAGHLRPPRPAFVGPLFALLLAAAGGESLAEPHVDPAPDPSAAETFWQWIAVRPSSATTCPSVAPGAPWQESALFPGSNEPLASFCRYRFTGGGAVTSLGALTDLVDDDDLDALAPDRMVVHGLGSLGGVLARHLAWRFDQHVGRIDLPVAPTAPPLRLSILDTSPTTGMNPSQLPESSPHGRTLQRFAEHLLCTSDPQACAAEITSRLALGYKDFEADELKERDLVQGGFYGTISDLASAIWEEVQQARQQSARLVLNLSVGWDPLYGGLEKDVRHMPPDVRAVYLALREAACSNAVVIAAAGNRTDEHGPQSGALLPAAWAERKDPSGNFCGSVGSSWAPQLLYAVGGVQGSGAPLANARPGSAGSLAAYADHATLQSEDGEAEPPLTGSSVAALVASATAAAVLHYRPGWSAGDVMQNLYDSGDALGRSAEMCQAFSCGAVRYLSLCQAVTRACSPNAPGHCPVSLPPCPARPLSPADVGDPLTLLASTPPAQRVDATDFEPTPHQGVCGSHQPSAEVGFLPPEPCPHRQRRGLGRQPWAHPQPSTDPCPNCTLFPGSGGMALEIDPNFTGTAANATLVTCPDSLTPAAYSFGSLALNAGDLVWVQGLQTPSCDSAFLSFTVTENDIITSALSPLLIAQP